MAELDQITVATKRWVRATPKLVDDIFQNDPLIAYAKTNCREDYPGGRYIAENFFYAGLIGGSYLPGKEFDISEPQVEQQGQFIPKFFEVNVTLTKEEIQVINNGPEVIFSLIKSRTTNAYMTIGAHLALAAYLNGINANYTPNFNGLAEALNDNTTASWDGNTYSTYGTLTRGGAIGPALNSPPTNVSGTIEYPTLEETYGDASIGQIEPNVGLTTAKGYSFIKEKFQTQQRFNDTQDPKIGFNGMRFNDAVLMKSRYAPGSYLYGSSGTADPNAVTYLKQMTAGAVTAYPAPSGGYPAAGVFNETLFWLNMRKPFFNFYMSSDPEYQFGITGFKPAQGNTKVVAQVLFAGNITLHPRYHRQLYGISG